MSDTQPMILNDAEIDAVSGGETCTITKVEWVPNKGPYGGSCKTVQKTFKCDSDGNPVKKSS